MGDVLFADFKAKSRKYTKLKDLPTVYLTEQEVDAIALMGQVDTAPSEMIPYHGEGIDGMYIAPEKDPA